MLKSESSQLYDSCRQTLRHSDSVRLGIWQKTAERMLTLRAREADASKDRRFKHPEWTANVIFNFVKDSYLVAAESIL